MESHLDDRLTPRGLLNCSRLLSRSHLEKVDDTLLAYAVIDAIRELKVYQRHPAAFSKKEHRHVSSSKR